MNRQDSLNLLQQCINELNNMTVEEFEKSLREKGLSQKRYDDSRYKDDAVMVVEKVMNNIYIICGYTI